METSNMRKMALFIAVAAVPSVASANTFTVPAIIPSAQAATPSPQPSTPPASVIQGSSSTPGVGTSTTVQPGGPMKTAQNTPPGASTDSGSGTSSGAPNLVSTGNGGVMTALPNHPPPPLSLLSPNVSLTSRQATAAAISRRWRNRVASPGEGSNGAVNYMFGASIPSVVCSPLYVCNIELQPGEVVNDIKAGDSVRWLITPSLVGSGSTSQTIVSVKPTDAGLQTNLIIATTKRLYDITLVSSSYAHTDEITFTYPEDVTAQWQAYQQQAQQRYINTTTSNGTNLAALDFGYSLSGDNPAWRPMRVYSDGIKTYIQFPRSMLSGDAPTLVALDRDGTWFSSPTKEIVNYRVEGDTYVVDRVLDRAALLSGVGGNQQEVEITHKGRIN
jgi:P-type conjugative transfer protein TrbG